MQKFKILPKTLIISPLLCFSKKRIFEEIAECVSYMFNTSTQDIINALGHREMYGSTVVCDGFAMPHAYVPIKKDPIAILAILSKPVSFNTIDTDPQFVDVVFSFFFTKEDDLAQKEMMLESLTTLMSNQELLTALRKNKYDEIKIGLMLNRIDGILNQQLANRLEHD